MSPEVPKGVHDSFGILRSDAGGDAEPDVDWEALSAFLAPVARDLDCEKARIAVENVVFDARLFRARLATASENAWDAIRQIAKAADLALVIFEGDRGEATRWMTTRTDFLFNRSPVEAVLGGNGETILGVLAEWLGRK